VIPKSNSAEGGISQRTKGLALLAVLALGMCLLLFVVVGRSREDELDQKLALLTQEQDRKRATASANPLPTRNVIQLEMPSGENVDVGKLRQLKGYESDLFDVEVISWEPRIFLLHNFLSEVECDELIKLGEAHLERSKVSVDDQRGRQTNNARTSYGAWIPNQSETVKNIERRIAAVSHVPISHQEQIYLLRYEEGQQYRPHYDWFDDNNQKEKANGGQRAATVVMYLHTPEQGGETIFPRAKGGSIRVPAIRGNAVLFFDTTLDAQNDIQALHGGEPVTKGVKWAATKWMRERPRK